jgi:hypothetical protein
MKASELRQIIKEEVYNVKLKMLDENIVQDIMALILSPKAKKAAKSLKSDPDFIELQKEIEQTTKSLEQINKRLERNLEKRQSITKDMQKSGIDVNMNMDADQIYNAFKTWQSKESKKVGKSEWEKYFK